MKKNQMVLSLISLGLTLIAFNSHAQSIAQKGHECSYEMVVPNLSCLNPDGDSDDVRLYVMEFQTCEKGSIIDLDRQITGFVATTQENGEKQITTTSDKEVSIQFSSQRTHFDDQEGDLTMILPESAIVRDGKINYELSISRKIQPNYEGASVTDWNYAGVFKKISAEGKILQSGRLICMVTR